MRHRRPSVGGKGGYPLEANLSIPSCVSFLPPPSLQVTFWDVNVLRGREGYNPQGLHHKLHFLLLLQLTAHELY